ncbi:MAG: p-aminobenzoyl-glutamate hydrolase subunit B [Gemmatimonadaceae bacterium]|nr:p-aminobenzoyl-glutamate hydrolase subunit B [Gemmatimonadaceae bacterium]
MLRRILVACVLPLAFLADGAAAQKPAKAAPVDPRLEKLKAEALTLVDGKAKMIQEMIDTQFSFGELGFQEFETSKFLMKILRDNGFTVDSGVAGIPTSWVARWGSGKPVISLGSDIDGIPQSNQKPAVGYRDFLVQGAPGHGEGHNSGQSVNIAAAIVVKDLMTREKIPGTLVIWPGVAEEQLGTKAYLVRAGVFKDVDVTLFTHVGSNLGVSYGPGGGNAMISAEFRFRGQTAHSAGAPWRGKSALDAVMLMAQGWEFHREHMEVAQRSHYVIKDGGDQPNVVPQTASIWFYFRHVDYPKTKEMFEFSKRVAQGAALMTDTKLDTIVILGSAWSGHFNKAVAEATYENIKRVGNPTWTDADQTLARGLQHELGVPENGLASKVSELRAPEPNRPSLGGGSDDIGDVSWNVPTVTLSYPSNIPGGPGHNWANAIAMATPIAHKGAVAGAKVQALTLLDLLLKPQVVTDAWDYFRNVQTKDIKYTAFIGPNDQPAIWLNADIMARYRPEMRKYYYDASKYSSYLEQLGIKYPTVRAIQ